MNDFTVLRLIQTLFGASLIVVYFVPAEKLVRIKWLANGRVNRQLMLFAGVILFIIGIWGKLPSFY
jgi:hypothetical protein